MGPEDLVDLVDPFALLVQVDTRIWEASYRMGRSRRVCAGVYDKDPSEDLGLYVTARTIAREIFEISEEGIVVVEKGRISWILEKPVGSIASRARRTGRGAPAWKALREILESDCIIVDDEEGRPVGMVTEDSSIRVLAKMIPEDLTAGDAASRPVETIDPEAPLLEAIGVMVQRGFRRLVLSSGEEPVGIITILDVIQWISDSHREGKLDEALVGGSVQSMGYEKPLVIQATASLASAARKLVETRSRCVLVVGEEGLGILTEKDLVRTLAEILRPRP